MPDQLAVHLVGREIQLHLNEISRLFKAGMKFTILARDPERPDGTRDMLITNDEIDSVIEALGHRKVSRG